MSTEPMTGDELDDIKRRIAAADNHLEKDTGIHPEDIGAIWLHGYGSHWPRVDLPRLHATVVRLEGRLSDTLAAMRRDGQGLTLDQEQTIRRGLRLP